MQLRQPHSFVPALVAAMFARWTGRGVFYPTDVSMWNLLEGALPFDRLALPSVAYNSTYHYVHVRGAFNTGTNVAVDTLRAWYRQQPQHMRVGISDVQQINKVYGCWKHTAPWLLVRNEIPLLEPRQYLSSHLIVVMARHPLFWLASTLQKPYEINCKQRAEGLDCSLGYGLTDFGNNVLGCAVAVPRRIDRSRFQRLEQIWTKYYEFYQLWAAEGRTLGHDVGGWPRRAVLFLRHEDLALNTTQAMQTIQLYLSGGVAALSLQESRGQLQELLPRETSVKAHHRGCRSDLCMNRSSVLKTLGDTKDGSAGTLSTLNTWCKALKPSMVDRVAHDAQLRKVAEDYGYRIPQPGACAKTGA